MSTANFGKAHFCILSASNSSLYSCNIQSSLVCCALFCNKLLDLLWYCIVARGEDDDECDASDDEIDTERVIGKLAKLPVEKLVRVDPDDVGGFVVVIVTVVV